jgi:SNF2 family DNA or RNA helicase
MIADESHYAKTYDAQRTKAAIKVAKTVPTDGLVLALTGTPITNRPAEYAAQLELLGRLQDFGGKWGFYRRYCGAFRDKWGKWHIDGNSNLDELNNKLRSTCYVRRVKEQVLKDLPPVVHAPLVVAGDAGPMSEYRKAEADIIKWLMERAAQIALELGMSVKSAQVRARMAAESNEHLVRLSVLRRLAAKAKMNVITEWVEQVNGEGRKVVIAAHHREIVDELARRFGGLKIQGGQDVAEVEAHKARFMNEDVSSAPVIVLSIQAAKTGHTLTAAQDVLFAELPWTPADVDQTYSRCHRIGQLGSVTATYLLAAGTVDQEIYDVVQSKRAVVDAATEGGEAGKVDMAKVLIGKYVQLGMSGLNDE